MSRVYNFCAGPAVLPVEALEEAQADFVDYKGSGMSILEASHRGKEYDAIHNEAIANLGKLMNLPEDYKVLLLPGGASQQFAMVPLNLLNQGQTADYVNSGTWGSKAVKEAKTIGKINVIADTAKMIPTTLPRAEDLRVTPGAAYLHITTNETIAGTQWKTMPQVDIPLVADMSSDILSCPRDYSKFALFYAGAQKNLGPSGLAIVVMRKEWAERELPHVPLFFRYKTHADENSLYNTPPCFSIYMLMLTTRWLIKKGGVEGVSRQNREKAGKLYDAIDQSGGYYRGTAVKEFRSDMNVTFRLPSEELEERFCKEASAAGMKQLKGHRSVGGVRASIYNAFPPEGVDALIAFMKEFQRKNG